MPTQISNSASLMNAILDKYNRNQEAVKIAAIMKKSVPMESHA